MQKTLVKIFIASSAELKAEREQCILLINQINKSHKHLTLEPVEWEYDMPAGNVPGHENIQAAINPKLQESNIAVFLFHSRLGKYTLQEFELAAKENKKMFAFFKSGFSPKKEQIKAYGELLDFRETLNDTILHCDFASEAEFKNVVFSNINLHLSENYTINSGLQTNQLSESLDTIIKLLAEKENKIKELIENKNNLPDVSKQLEKLEVEKENIRRELLANREMVEQLTKEKEELKKQLAPQIKHDSLKAKAFSEIEKGNYIEAENYLKESAKDSIEEAASTFFELGKLKKLQLQYKDAFTYMELAAKVDSQNIFYLNEAGLLSLTMGLNSVAFDFFKKALLVSKENRGEENASIAALYNNLGSVYRRKGEFDNAIEFYEKALSIDKKLFGNENPRIATRYNNLGSVYTKKGELDKAIQYSDQALAIFKKFHEDEHSDIATCYNNLGLAYRSKGKLDKAIEFYEKALSIDKKLFGDENPRIATRYNNLGSVYTKKGELDKAIQYYDQALSIDKKFHGEEHPDIAICYNNLGLVYDKKGDFNKAIMHYENALSIDKKFHGEEHPDIATRYNNIGVAFRNRGDLDKAIGFYEKALTIGSIFFSSSHPTIKTITKNLLTAKKAKEKQ